MIGRNGERRSGISAQAARHDDDDDIYTKLVTIVDGDAKALFSIGTIGSRLYFTLFTRIVHNSTPCILFFHF